MNAKLKKRWVGHVAQMGEKRGSGGETRGKESTCRPWRRCEGNIKMNFQEEGFWDYGLDRAGSG